MERSRHILITGRSGAGKSTYAKKLSKELKRQHIEADSDPEMQALFNQSFPRRDDRFRTRDFKKGELAYRRGIMRRIKKLKEPTILEGAQFSWINDPSVIEQAYVVKVPERVRVKQRYLREKRLGRVYQGEKALRREERLKLYTQASDPFIREWERRPGTKIVNPYQT